MLDIIILILASFLDYLIGDPWTWIHPVKVMGWIINKYTQFFLKFNNYKWGQKLAGIVLGITLIFGSGILSWLLFFLVAKFSYWLSFVLQVILLASCFATRSLNQAANDVLIPFAQGDLSQARSKLSLYVGRDTDNLTAEEILRAVLETVAENTTDGVSVPLFYALLGGMLGVGCTPLAIAYKASSTLDSMIGYREAPFTQIGWFSAKFEDYLTFIPCRLTVFTLALISGKPNQVLSICSRDAIKDSSPNSGWSEAVYAAILGVQLGGENTYKGIVKQKPLLGDSIYPISEIKINEALNLTRICFLTWLILGSGILVRIEIIN